MFLTFIKDQMKTRSSGFSRRIIRTVYNTQLPLPELFSLCVNGNPAILRGLCSKHNRLGIYTGCFINRTTRRNGIRFSCLTDSFVVRFMKHPVYRFSIFTLFLVRSDAKVDTPSFVDYKIKIFAEDI